MSGGPSYRNPVYPGSCPDPFVLKLGGEYWCYCTGVWHDGRCFGVLRSRDLAGWQPLAGAMEPLPGGFPCYWAPEVVYDNGRFYLYYSVGDEERMEIRVAVAASPEGPFRDQGVRLTSEPFAIDAHVFADAQGRRWMFYATDFLEHSHIGTGTVRDRMLDPFTLAGDPRPVTLPRHDWQVYHPRRPEKGNVRWHTVEGPFVLERKGLLYQMFSGGNWQNPTYGVSYATSRRVEGDPEGAEWTQAADGGRVLPILRTLPGEVVGPGHNSVVRGPDNRQLYCVYHRWSDDASARVLCIDPLDWAGERMLVLGPSTSPRPIHRPTVEGLAGGGAIVEAGASSFLCEVTARSPEPSGRYGLALYGETGLLFEALLPSGFDPAVFHHFRLEVDGPEVSVQVDGTAARWRSRLNGPASRVALVSEGAPAEFPGFALTVGWEDLFEDERELLDWQVRGGEARVGEGRLLLAPAADVVRITRGPALAGYCLVVNARLEAGSGGGYLFFPALDAAGEGPALALGDLPLPAGFDPSIDQQFRFWKRDGRVEVSWEGRPLGAVDAPAGPTVVGLGARDGRVSFEMVRVTALAS